MTSINERIVNIRKTLDTHQRRFADIIGVQQPTLSNVEQGNNKPSTDFLQKLLAAVPNLNANWLLTGHGEMFLDGEAPAEVKSQSDMLKEILRSKDSEIESIYKQMYEKEKENSETLRQVINQLLLEKKGS